MRRIGSILRTIAFVIIVYFVGPDSRAGESVELPTTDMLPPANEVLERSLAKYGYLTTYADTGTVINEFGTGSKERHTFSTYFSRSNPRGFYLDFKKESGERYVIWGDPDAFHTWWSATHVKSDYPNPDNIGAFTGADVRTIGATMKVVPLLYPKASMQGSFTNYNDAASDGTEDVGGHKCYRLVGTARDIYGATGHESNVRRMTVWIDADSLLIRKVVEIPKDILPGHIDRTTTEYEPQANPSVDRARFSFTPPSK
jgi:hypothetical protein